MKRISTQRAEKIARNINAMDLNYEYINQYAKYKFWNELRSKLFKILNTLSQTDKDIIKNLCDTDKAKYFNLV